MKFHKKASTVSWSHANTNMSLLSKKYIYSSQLITPQDQATDFKKMMFTYTSHAWASYTHRMSGLLHERLLQRKHNFTKCPPCTNAGTPISLVPSPPLAVREKEARREKGNGKSRQIVNPPTSMFPPIPRSPIQISEQSSTRRRVHSRAPRPLTGPVVEAIGNGGSGQI